MTKKKNKRERPTRRGAERAEQSGQPAAKKVKQSHADTQPFMQTGKGGGAPPSSAMQAQARGAGQAKTKPAAQHRKPAAAAASSSSSSAAAPKKVKKVVAEAASDDAADTYTTARLDGLALAQGTDPSVCHAGIETDSAQTSRLFFEWLIFPMSIESFYADYFEQKPLYISRRDIEAKLAQATIVTTKQTLQEMVPKKPRAPTPAADASNKPAAVSTSAVKTVANALKTEKVTVVDVAASKKPAAAAASSSSHYYSNWFSIPDIHALLRQPELDIQYRRDVDITRYRGGVRETLNPSGLASEAEVKKFVSEACSLRFLCPQKYSEKLWAMLSRLDEFFGMQTGANSYYTPKGTQGFAPHFDDVDIFVIQTEGSKRWRLYPPRSPSEILPSVSSPNFAQTEIGTPVMDVLLSAGDFLYAPRGTIHQCVASLEEASLHVTLSTCLNTNWAAYLGHMLPRALQLAADQRASFRQSLPPAYDQYMGVMHSDRPSRGRREQFMDTTLQLLEQMMDLDLLPFDAAADQMATDFMHGRCPPPPPSSTVHRKRTFQPGGTVPKSMFKPTTCVRLVRAGVARVTTHARGDQVTLHHTLANSRLFKDQPLAEIDFPIGYVDTFEAVINAYPQYCRVDQLPAPRIDDPENEDAEVDPKVAFQDLVECLEQMFEEGLLEVTNDPNAIPEELRLSDNPQEDEEEEGDEKEMGEDDAMEQEEDEDQEQDEEDEE